MDKPAVRDAALLVLRLVVGGVLIARGVSRFLITGPVRTTQQFTNWGVPQPKLSSYLVPVLEALGGAILIVGVLTTIVAGLLMVMVGVGAYIVNLPHGLLAENQGIEYPLVMMAALLMIVVFGPGRASLDRVLASD